MISKDYREPSGFGDFRQVKLTSFPYLTLADVQRIYRAVNDGNANGLEQFAQKARDIAVKVPGVDTEYMYQFKNEVALFELFEEVMPQQLARKGINNFGRLMQYIS